MPSSCMTLRLRPHKSTPSTDMITNDVVVGVASTAIINLEATPTTLVSDIVAFNDEISAVFG